MSSVCPYTRSVHEDAALPKALIWKGFVQVAHVRINIILNNYLINIPEGEQKIKSAYG